MARQTTKSKKEQSPSRILEAVYAFRPARVLLTSFELGIFTAIGDSPKESREIAQTLGTSERATDRLMNALCGMGFLKKKGTIVVEFLDPIPPGLSRREFMPRLETAIESATAKLVEEGQTQLAN